MYPSFCSVGLLGSKLLPEIISSILNGIRWLWPHPLISKCRVKSLKKCQPVVAGKRALNTGNGGPIRWGRFFSNSIYAKKDRNGLPSDNQRWTQMRPCCLHPPDAPTHLPLSCWSRTYVQRTLLEVTSWSWVTWPAMGPKELINEEASSIKVELFNGIHGDSDGYLHRTIYQV